MKTFNNLNPKGGKKMKADDIKKIVKVVFPILLDVIFILVTNGKGKKI